MKLFRGLIYALSLTGICCIGALHAQVVTEGAGSYTTALPPGASGPETATPFTTAAGPVNTHKFWTSKYWTNLSGGVNMFPEPLQANAAAQGMTIGTFDDVYGYDTVLNTSDKSGNTSAFYQGFVPDMTIGNATMNASAVNISASSDWSADFTWGPSLTIRMGRGMPFAYVLTDGTPVTLAFLNSPVILSGTIGTSSTLAVSVTSTPYGLNYTNYYGLFCPAGGVWSQNGNTLTCTTPAGSNYMSVGLLPGLSGTTSANANINATTIAQQMADFSKVAFSFPTNTQVSWAYNQSSSTVTTTYTVTTQSMDGVSTGFLMALYPHQYDALAGGVNTSYTYLTTFGNLEVNSGTSFTTTDTFHGILPFMPPTTNYNLATLKAYVDEAPPAALVGDDYDQGKLLGQVAQDLPLAQLADASAYTSLDSSLTGILQNWYTASGKTTDLFYYDNEWNSLIGYPAGYYADTQLDDHHFHYGYFIHASAIQGLFDPSWITSAQWGGMATLLQQDIANYDRTNTMFPFLRHFDVYAGHSWASGTAPFGDGGNEESSSEAVNAWTGMILLGEATGNTQLRDAAIWLYTQETKGVAYYWFNEQPTWVNANATRTFPSWFTKLSIANVFDDKGDTGTWFGAQPDYEHAIEFLPFTGGSLHLGLDPTYVQANYLQDQTENTAQSMSIANQWPDLMEMYEAFSSPQTALTQWLNNPSGSFPQAGESLAHEYAWLMSLNALGQVDATVTANTPLYAVFNNNGAIAHVAFNASSTPITVTFSDGATVSVPASSMASDSALVTPITLGGTTTGQAPVAPTGLTATAASANEIDLTWTFAANVTYNVFRSTASGFTPASSDQIAAGLTAAAYKDLSLTASTTYYYVVEAVNSTGTSPASAQVSTTTLASGGTTAGSNTLYLVGGATATVPSQLSFTADASGIDSMIANNPQTVGTPENPLIYTIKGINGTYAPTASTIFNLYVDAGANAGEGAQAEVIYDLLGDGTQLRTEVYSLFATDPVVGFEDYQQNSRGGLSSSTGTLANMTNGTVTLEVWDALPGGNSQPISLSVGNNTSALSDLVIPFTGITQGGAATGQAPVAPTGLTATAASANEIDLTWTFAANVTYNVFRSTVSGFTPASSNQIAAGLTAAAYKDLSLTASTTYYYLVEATNASGNSAASNQASATTNGAPIPQSINFTAPASPVVYGVAPITLSATGGGSDNAIVFSIVSGPGSISGDALTVTGVGTIAIAANQAGNANYSAATQVTASIVVNQASQTIAFAPVTPVTYGTAPITLSATGGGSDNAIVFSIVSGPGSISGDALTVTGAGTIAIAANQAGNANYSAATQVTASIVVNRATLTVTATSESVVYGAVDPDRCGNVNRHLTYTITGLVNGQTLKQVLTGSPNESTTATPRSNVGIYAIAVTKGSLQPTPAYANNYTLVFVNGTLSIFPAKLYVVANSYSRAIDTSNPPFGYTIYGFVNGDKQWSATTGAPACCTTTATIGSPADIYPIVIGPGTLAANNGNYTFTFENGILIVCNPRNRHDQHTDGNGSYRPNPQFDMNYWPDSSSYDYYWGNGGGGPNIILWL